MLKFLTIFLFFLMSSTSYAYLGPGIGGGIIVATFGLICAIIVIIFGIIWFPLKRFFKKKEKKIIKDKSDN